MIHFLKSYNLSENWSILQWWAKIVMVKFFRNVYHENLTLIPIK